MHVGEPGGMGTISKSTVQRRFRSALRIYSPGRILAGLQDTITAEEADPDRSRGMALVLIPTGRLGGIGIALWLSRQGAKT
jgi:hypothetical protein